MIDNQYSFEQINLYESARQPGTVHAKNNALYYYFSRYLIQKIISIYEFKNLPETWAENYFLYTLFLEGRVGIIDTDRYGVIPQSCNLAGYNVFRQPRYMLVANPLLEHLPKLEIGINCELIKMQPDYMGPLDIVSTYAELLALCMESAGVNLLNSKLAFVFAAGNKTQAEAFKKVYDQIASGQPAAFVDKELFNEDGSRNWDVFFQNLKQNYVTGDILNDMVKITDRFNTTIGIPNANTEKRERLITDEVNANNADTETLADLWLRTMQGDIKRVNKMFGLDLAVDYKFKGGATNAARVGIADNALSL